MCDAPISVERILNKVYFYSEVTAESSLMLNKLLKEAEQEMLWKNIQHNTVPVIYLHINSPGGDVPCMFSIMETIRLLSVPVHTFVDGEVCSAAAIIFLAGTKRYMPKNSFLMLHQISGQKWGKHEDFKDHLKMQKMYTRTMVNFIASRAKLTKKEIRKNMRRDWWMSSKQAKKAGIVDKII